MDTNDPILNCVSVPWGSTQKLPTWQYMQNWVATHALFVDQLVQSLKHLDYIHIETENKLLKEFFEAITKNKWDNPLTTLGNQLAKYMRTTPPVKIKKPSLPPSRKNSRFPS